MAVAQPQTRMLPSSSRTVDQRDLTAGASGAMTEKRYNNLNRNIIAIQGNLKAIASLITQRGAQEAEEDRQEIRAQNVERDRISKGRTESAIEKAIKTGLMKPIKAMQKKLAGPFEALFNAVKSIFMGWLGIKGLEALEAWTSGDKDKLEELKGQLIQGLAIAGGVGLALTAGVGLVTGAVSGLVGLIISSLPALIALMANPYVWLGAGIIYAGFRLNQLFGDQRSLDSYSDTKSPSGNMKLSKRGFLEQIVMIDGVESGRVYLESEIQRLEKLYGTGLINSDMYGDVAALKQQLKELNEGRYDEFDKAGDPRTFAPNQINTLAKIDEKLGEVRPKIVEQRRIEAEIKQILPNPLTHPDNLSKEDKEKYDDLISQRDANRTALNDVLKAAEDLRRSLGVNSAAHTYYMTVARRSGLSTASDGAFKREGLNRGFRIPQLNHIDKARSNLETVRKIQATSPLNQAGSGGPAMIDDSKFLAEVRAIAGTSRYERAIRLEVNPMSSPNVTVVPVNRDIEAPTQNVPTTDPGTPMKVPGFSTMNPFNEYLDFSIATYGIR